MVEVGWTVAATRDLDEIRAYIKLFDPAAAAHIADSLIDLAQSLSRFPNRGRPVTNGRRELVSVPPYILRYVVEGNAVTILSVRHGRRRPLR